LITRSPFGVSRKTLNYEEAVLLTRRCLVNGMLGGYCVLICWPFGVQDVILGRLSGLLEAHAWLLQRFNKAIEHPPMCPLSFASLFFQTRGVPHPRYKDTLQDIRLFGHLRY